MICLTARHRLASLSDTGRPPSRALERHLARCPRCRAFREELLRIERLAAVPADVAPCRAPAALRARILAAAGAAAREAHVPPSPVSARAPRLAIACALALAATAAWWALRPSAPQQAPDWASAAPAADYAFDGTLSVAAVTDFQPDALELERALAAPYRNEIDSLVRDLSRAADYLFDCLGNGG